MRKIGKIVLLLFMGCFFSAVAFAQAQQVPIEIIRGEESILLKEAARVEGRNIYVPVDVITGYIYKEAALDERNKQLELRFSMPKVKFNQADLDSMLFSGCSFSLPVMEFDGKRYVNLYGMESIFGADQLFDQTENKLKLYLNRYSFFSPAKLSILDRKIKPAAGEKISLVWQPTFEQENNLSKIEPIKGLSVVSPSWFSIVDEWGTVKNDADLGYVEDAHAKGYEVWALITNSFDPDLTEKVLHNPSARKNVIKQLLLYASMYRLDGINLDYENIYDSDKEALTQFVKEITQALHKINVTVSMDVTAPSKASQWSLSYDRKAIGETVDYVMLMAYDEHWRTSPVSGSVASIGWVEEGVKNTLKEVPKEKLVLGVPFYMRKWEENPEMGKVKASTLTMEDAAALREEKNAKVHWLKDQGQNYFEYKENGKLYRVWVEDEKSMELKLNLVDKYGLAGVAGWRKGFETPDIWALIEREVHKKVAAREPGMEKKHKQQVA